MELLKFVAKSSDEEFARDLDDHLDVKSFARYLALQTLLSNSDGMDGPGNNYYLWYDTTTRRFTVLSWDLNLAYSGMSAMLGNGNGDVPVPGNGQMPSNGQRPGGAGGQGPSMSRGSGALNQRFMVDDGFKKLYQNAYRELYRKLIASGAATKALNSAVSDARGIGDDKASSVKKDIAQKIKGLTAEP